MDMLRHLLARGHKYEVGSLVRFCSERVAVSEENAIDRLLMAEQLNLDLLKEQIMDFICSCCARFARAQKSEAFGRLVKSYPQVMAELVERTTQPPQKKARTST